MSVLRHVINVTVGNVLWSHDLSKRIEAIAQEHVSTLVTDDLLRTLVTAAAAPLPPVSAEADAPEDEADDPNDVTVTIVFTSGAVINVDVPSEIAQRMSDDFKYRFEVQEPLLGTYRPPDTLPIRIVWANVEMLY